MNTTLRNMSLPEEEHCENLLDAPHVIGVHQTKSIQHFFCVRAERLCTCTVSGQDKIYEFVTLKMGSKKTLIGEGDGY
jgi:hypothetical protein